MGTRYYCCKIEQLSTSAGEYEKKDRRFPGFFAKPFEEEDDALSKQAGGGEITMSVEDEGPGGDGLILSFHADWRSDPVVLCCLSRCDAEMLIEALKSCRRMAKRAAENEFDNE